jgi:hypothetical protein
MNVAKKNLRVGRDRQARRIEKSDGGFATVARPAVTPYLA